MIVALLKVTRPTAIRTLVQGNHATRGQATDPVPEREDFEILKVHLCEIPTLKPCLKLDSLD